VTSGDDPFRVLSDAQWALIEGLLPRSEHARGPNFKNNLRIVEGILYRLRTGVPWRHLPVVFGPWKTVWKRQRRYAADGTWDRIVVALAALADDNAAVDWAVPTRRSCGRISMRPGPAASMLATQGAPSNYTNRCVEPVDHGIGRSRGGLSTKIHAAVEGGGRLLSALITPGQAGRQAKRGQATQPRASPVPRRRGLGASRRGDDGDAVRLAADNQVGLVEPLSFGDQHPDGIPHVLNNYALPA
jgi:transposase